MSFNEKLFIVAISVGLSFLMNIILYILFRTIDRQKKINCARENLKLLSRNMEAAIIHESTRDIDVTVNRLLKDYDVFLRIPEMKNDFQILFDCSVFCRNNGYHSNPERKQRDLERVLDIRDRNEHN